ncbi:MAG: hypothetical protein RLY93_20875 [Sumerlaeia bacterium]
MVQLSRFFFEGIPGEAFPGRTPFEIQGDCSQTLYFFYLTNRTVHRWSLLLSRIDHGYELTSIIPMGYAQLWTFQMIHCAHPSHNRERSAQDLKARELPGVPSRGNWLHRVHMVLQEPHREHPTSDLVALCPDQESAVRLAKQYAEEYGRPAVVGLIIGDEQWH